jgi:hypothetical protein
MLTQPVAVVVAVAADAAQRLQTARAVLQAQAVEGRGGVSLSQTWAAQRP